MSNKRRPAKRSTGIQSVCTICGHKLPSPFVYYDPESYENAVVRHMLRCSATPAAHRKPSHTDTVAVKVTPSQLREEDLDKKPAAEPFSTSSDTPAETTTEGEISSGKDESVALSSPFLHSLLLAPKSANYAKRKSPSGSCDTPPTASTTKDDMSSAKSNLSIPSTHLLAQTWWRPQRVQRRSTGVSIPFNLEHCVTVNTKEENDTDLKPTRASKRLRGRSQSRHETLQVACPVCKKAFSGTMILTEQAMSQHVGRCSRKFLDGEGHVSQQVATKNKLMENIAVVNALSRVRNGVASEKRAQKTIDDSQAHAAAWAERRASVNFLLHGPGKRALDNFILGMDPA